MKLILCALVLAQFSYSMENNYRYILTASSEEESLEQFEKNEDFIDFEDKKILKELGQIQRSDDIFEEIKAIEKCLDLVTKISDQKLRDEQAEILYKRHEDNKERAREFAKPFWVSDDSLLDKNQSTEQKLKNKKNKMWQELINFNHSYLYKKNDHKKESGMKLNLMTQNYRLISPKKVIDLIIENVSPSISESAKARLTLISNAIGGWPELKMMKTKTTHPVPLTGNSVSCLSDYVQLHQKKVW